MADPHDYARDVEELFAAYYPAEPRTSAPPVETVVLAALRAADARGEERGRARGRAEGIEDAAAVAHRMHERHAARTGGDAQSWAACAGDIEEDIRALLDEGRER